MLQIIIKQNWRKFALYNWRKNRQMLYSTVQKGWERQQGADRNWWGRRALNLTTYPHWLVEAPPPAFQLAFSGNIKASPHQTTAERLMVFSVAVTHKADPNEKERPVDTNYSGRKQQRNYILPHFHSSIQHRQSSADGSHYEKPGWDGLVKEPLCFYLQAHPGGGTKMGGLTWQAVDTQM